MNYIDPLNPPVQPVKVQVLSGADRHRFVPSVQETTGKSQGYHWGTDGLCIAVFCALWMLCVSSPKWYPVAAAWFR